MKVQGIGHKPRARACALVALLVAGLSTRVGHAGRDVDWSSVAKLADAQHKELAGKPCTAETPQAEVQALAAANLRLASFYDFAARHLPENLPAQVRAGKLYSLFARGVAAYQRGYECAPGYEHRDALAAALALIEFATQDLDKHPGEDKEAALTEYKELRAQVEAKWPPSPSAPECKPCAKCGGPPPLERRGCSIGGTRRGEGQEDVLFALGLGWIAWSRCRARRTEA